MNVYLGELYKEVEYIQSSGTQYINTGYAPSNNTKVILSMGGRVSNVERYGTLFGARKGWTSSDWNDSKGFSITHDRNSGYVVMFGRGYNNNISTVPDFGIMNGNNHIVQEGGDGIYIDGTLKMSLEAYTFTSPVPMSIFCDNINGEQLNFNSYKLYYFKIYESGALVRDFIPCYRVSDNVIGLFDKVNNKFYANAGTGTFTKGNDVKVFQPELKNAYIGEYIPLIQNASLLGNTNTKQDVQGVRFSPDGTKMFVGFWNLSYVTEYTLSTPFNPSTKTEIRTLSGTYQNSGMWFNYDGTIMILATRINSSPYPTNIQKYTLSTPFALNTATLVQSYNAGNGKFTSGVCLSDDGKKIYINIDGEGIYQGTMSTAFDLSTISLSSGVFSSGGRGIALRGNGKILYTSNSNSVGDYGTISQYKLDTPYDILGSKTLLSTFNAGGGEGTALWVREDMKYFSWCLGGSKSQDVRMFKIE